MSQNEMLGTKIGEAARPFPGLTPVSKSLSACLTDVAVLEAAKYEADWIRATLLLNFGNTAHNHYGFNISETDTTPNLLMAVLMQLTKRDVGQQSKEA